MFLPQEADGIIINERLLRRFAPRNDSFWLSLRGHEVAVAIPSLGHCEPAKGGRGNLTKEDNERLLRRPPEADSSQ